MSMELFIKFRQEERRKTEETARNHNRLREWKEKIRQIKRGHFSSVPLVFPEVRS